MIQIIPSLLVTGEEEFLRQYRGLAAAVEMIQIDIADGKFIPNTTWADPAVIKKNVSLDCELHLMVSNPLAELKKWGSVEQIRRILVHYESVPNLKTILPTLHAYGWDISLVLNPETPIEAINPYLSAIKGVMFMGVHPGRQGQVFIPETLNRIRAFKAKGTDHFVEIDGAVNEQTLPSIIASGVDAICPGSAIFGNERTPAENVGRMRESIYKLTNTA